MTIPLLNYKPVTQNQRVPGYEVPNEDTPTPYRLTAASSETNINEIIWAGYRQIFSEHLILESYRQPYLESQMRNRALTVREFIRGLAKSDVYRRLVAETNSNYRLVDITLKRILGRASYGRDEEIAWSIVIATSGLEGFIDTLIDSDEYRQNFGDDIIPYQRRRFKDRPFNLVNPRYSDYWRNRQISLEGSHYQVRFAGQGNKAKQSVRDSIPATFLTMAKSVIPGNVNYQEMSDRARNTVSSFKIADPTSNVQIPEASVGITNVALPYRYIPGTPKV